MSSDRTTRGSAQKRGRMKRKICFGLAGSILAAGVLFGGYSEVSAAGNKMPELHEIGYPETLQTTGDEYGADAFAHELDHSDSRYYVVNDYYNMESDETLHIIPRFQTYQQTTEYTCGCAAAVMVLEHYGVNSYDEMQIAKLAGTHETMGTSVEGLRDFFLAAGFAVDCHADTNYRFDSIESCEEYFLQQIDAGNPIMVDWTDWGGHWQVVIGLDTCGTESPYDDVLILADPYDVTDHYQDGYYTYPFGRFFSMWREGACADKEIPYEQPFILACPWPGQD